MSTCPVVNFSVAQARTEAALAKQQQAAQKLAVNSPPIPSSLTKAPKSNTRPVCYDFRDKGSCSRSKCRFSHAKVGLKSSQSKSKQPTESQPTLPVETKKEDPWALSPVADDPWAVDTTPFAEDVTEDETEDASKRDEVLGFEVTMSQYQQSIAPT